jgi:hypothetical protein
VGMPPIVDDEDKSKAEKKKAFSLGIIILQHVSADSFIGLANLS